MNLTAEQLQIASIIDAKMQELVCDGNEDKTRALILTQNWTVRGGLEIFHSIWRENFSKCPHRHGFRKDLL